MDLMVKNSRIYLENDLGKLNTLLHELKLRDKLFIITDSNLYSLYKNQLLAILDYHLEFIVIPAGEASKNIDNALMIIKKLLEGGIKRKDTIIGFGGGVVSDITGFVASMLYRGIGHIIVSTSLLADVDAAIGGKTGVDFYNRKNIIGSFYEPKLIYIAKDLLKTLPKGELASGYGEIIKYAFLEPNMQSLLLNNQDILEVIKASILIKKKYVEADFYDEGLRMELNLGHTFGHIVEIKYGLPHGIAVISGLKMIFSLERDLGLIDNSFLKKLDLLLNKLQITAPDFDYKEYLAEIFNDKKNLKGTLNLVFVKENGAYLYSKTKEELDAEISSR